MRSGEDLTVSLWIESTPERRRHRPRVVDPYEHGPVPLIWSQGSRSQVARVDDPEIFELIHRND